VSEEFLAKGTFRVDRRRALEKMEKFQLADPIAYVLELVAAAVTAGAALIEVTNDADDLVIAWQGELPTRAELDGVFDALFGAADTPRAAMLQHLAMGVLGALGQSPRWLHIDRGAVAGEPALRLAVVDPTETRALDTQHDARAIRVHVRQAPSLAVLGKALTGLFTEPPETRLLRARTRWCPVPILVGGKPLLSTGAPRPTPLGAPAVTAGETPSELWLVRDTKATIDLVRHGVTVGQASRILGPFALSGWARDDGIALDASRGNILEDARHAALRARLDVAFAAHIPTIGSFSPPLPDGELLDALRWCATHGHAPGPLAPLPLLRACDGRAWSVDALAAFTGAKGFVDEAGLQEPGFLTFPIADKPLLDPLVDGLVDLTPVLTRRRLGRERRAAAVFGKPEFTGAQLRFEDGLLRGSVRWREGDEPTLHVRLWIGGAQVQQVHLPSPAGPMEAILEHPGFTADDAFEVVLDDPVRVAALARLDAAARQLAAEHIASGGQRPPALDVLAAALRAHGARAREDLAALLARHPDDPVLRAPAFRLGSGQQRALPDLLGSREPWILSATVPLGCPPALAARVLRIPEPAQGVWLSWLGTRAQSGQTLEEDVRGAQRRALPPRPAALPSHVSVRAAVSADGWKGELGLDGDATANVELLRAGIPITRLPLTNPLPGLVGVLDRLDVRVTRAHDAVAEPEAVERLRGALRPYVEDLVRRRWGDALAPPADVSAWLIGEPALPEWALERPIARTLGGQAWTLGDVRKHAAKRHHARIKLISSPPEAPGFDDAIVVDPALRSLLTRIGGRAVRDADEDVQGARRNVEQYLARPTVRPPRAVAERVEDIDGTTLHWVLPEDPERIGVLRVEALWNDRLLAAWERGESLGLHALVKGAGIAPAASMSMLADPNQLSKWSKRARTRLAAIAGEALDTRASGIPSAERATWRALLARVDSASERSKEENTLRDRLAALPLFPRLDGTVVSRDAIAGTTAWHLPAGTPATETDSPWYILEEPWTLRALGSLPVTPGTERLAAWREAERRRRTLPRREAILTDRGLHTAPIALDGATGELALLPLDRPVGLSVTALVDGLPLAPVFVSFPTPAAAIVTGPAIVADAALETWPDTPASEGVREALKRAAHTLARSLAEEPGVREELRRWLYTYTLAAPSAGDLPVFPALDGGRVSLATLSNPVAVVPPGRDAMSFVTGRAPLVAGPWLREALARRFTLVDLDFVAQRHAHRLPKVLPPSQPDDRAAVTFAPGGTVTVIRDGVLLDTLEVARQGGIVPLAGSLLADAEVDAAWTALTPASLADVQQRLATLARALVQRELDRIAQGAPLPRSLLLTALANLLPPDAPHTTARIAADPLLAAIAALPLFRDAAGATGTLLDLVRGGPIRCVAIGVTGRPAPGRPPIWQIDPAERSLIERFCPLVDATETLRAETRGAVRREATRGRPPSPRDPAAALPLDADAGATGALWLGGDGVELRVDGCRVMVWSCRLRDLGGWVEGDFPTDAAFEAVTLPHAVTQAIRKTATTLLSRLPTPALHRRISEAIGGGSPADLLKDTEIDWGALDLCRDSADKPIRLADVLKLHKSGVLLIGAPGAAPPKRGARVLVGGDDLAATLRLWFPDARVTHVDAVAAEVNEKRQSDAARKAANSRIRRQSSMLAAARKLYRGWTGRDAPPTLDAQLARWIAGKLEGWPPFDSVDGPGTWPALLAFSVGGADPDADVRMACAERMAEAL
jgi:hypothetical protein